MLKRFILGTMLMLSAAAGVSHAQPLRTRPPTSMNRYERLANEWVQLYLRRNATPREVLMMTNQLRAGMSANEVQATILSSPEYFRRAGGNINTWANWVVNDVLGRPSTPYERALVTQIQLRDG